MHDTDLNLPSFTSILVIFIVFSVTLASSHYFLVYKGRATNKTWHIIDYVWLSLVLIGIISQLHNNSSEYAKNVLPMAHDRSNTYLSQLIRSVDFGISSVCQNLNIKNDNSASSNVIEEKKREHDSQCGWFRSVDKLIKKTWQQ